MNNEKIEDYGSQKFLKDGIKFCTTRGRSYNGCFPCVYRIPYLVGVNLAVSFSCIVGCPICKIYLVDHGYRNFKEKIHFME